MYSIKLNHNKDYEKGIVHFIIKWTPIWDSNMVPSRGNSKHHDPEAAECWVADNTRKISTITYCYAMTLSCTTQDGSYC